MAVKKGVFHPSRLIGCAPFPVHPANLLTPTHPGAPPIEPPFSTCAPANLLTSTRALQLRSSAFLLAHPDVWKLAALALRSLLQALRASRAERRASGEPSGWVLQVARVLQPTRRRQAEKPLRAVN